MQQKENVHTIFRNNIPPAAIKAHVQPTCKFFFMPDTKLFFNKKNQIIGFVLCDESSYPKHLTVSLLAIDEQFHRKGCGSTLIKKYERQ